MQQIPVDKVTAFVRNLVAAADAVGLPMCISAASLNYYGDLELKNSGNYYTGTGTPLQTGNERPPASAVACTCF
jgi:hypothetical protein